MDDFRGTEQWAVRNLDKLPQDGEYLRTTFSAIWHVCTGDETRYTTENPVRYTRWRMPEGDFSIVLTDSRLWRTTTYADIWEKAQYYRGKEQITKYGWEGLNGWDRLDPTRNILGEKQFSWLEQIIKSDPSHALLVVGINGLHSITHEEHDVHPPYSKSFQDFGGFNKASADRLIDLFSSREGVFSIYGDLHFSAVLKNRDHRVVECVIGSVCRTGSRKLKPDWGETMTDWDGRPVEIMAMYRSDYQDPQRTPLQNPPHFGFVELEFDVEQKKQLEVNIRKLEDQPSTPVRGGGPVRVDIRQTGDEPLSYLPDLQTMASADLRVTDTEGLPIRGCKANQEGWCKGVGLNLAPNTSVIVISRQGDNLASRILKTTEKSGTRTVVLK
jgi:hypothetical protein